MHSCSSMGYLARSMSQATVDVILPRQRAGEVSRREAGARHPASPAPTPTRGPPSSKGGRAASGALSARRWPRGGGSVDRRGPRKDTPGSSFGNRSWAPVTSFVLPNACLAKPGRGAWKTRLPEHPTCAEGQRLCVPADRAVWEQAGVAKRSDSPEEFRLLHKSPGWQLMLFLKGTCQKHVWKQMCGHSCAQRPDPRWPTRGATQGS